MATEEKTAVVPRLRFPKFRDVEGWKPKLLGEVCGMQSGKFIPASEISEKQSEGLYPCFGGNGLRGYTKNYSHSGRYSLIGRQGALCGNVNLVEGDFYATEHAVVTTPKSGISIDWNFCNLCFLDLNRFATGQAQPGLSINVLEKVDCAVPIDEQEQQKIADCLNSLDELIVAQGRKVEALRTYKCGLMQQLFPREGESCPRLRFPEFANTGAWHTKKVASLLSKASFALSVEPEETYREIGIRSHGKGIFHKEPVFGKVIGDKRVFKVVQDALVLNIVFAWEQAVATTSDKEVGMIASHRFPMYVAKPGKCDVEYVKGFFLTKEGKRLLGVASPGGAGRNKTLGQRDFENLEIVLPVSVNEQTRIANCLSSCDATITIESDKLESLKAHKKGLMQQLFPSLEAA